MTGEIDRNTNPGDSSLLGRGTQAAAVTLWARGFTAQVVE